MKTNFPNGLAIDQAYLSDQTIRRISEDAAGGLLHIDLDALASNWRTLRERAGGADTAAVVKANAYGIGIEQAVPALPERAAARSSWRI